MKLIVGLGNPGDKYTQNRHNVGFMFVDYIAQLLDFSIVKKNKDYITKEQSDNPTIVLVKPQIFMNASGRAVKNCVTHYGLRVSDELYVVHDDLDIRLGEYKIQFGKGPKLHNGIESIENHLHTKEFTRVRIGVDNRSSEDRMAGERYVLENFRQSEQKIIESIFPVILKSIVDRKSSVDF